MHDFEALTIHRSATTGKQIILSVITVVKGDLAGLIETAQTVEKIAPNDLVQYVIWINSASTELIDSLHLFSTYADLVISGKDSGIFDAMNRALEFCTGNFVLFLNARDRVVEPFSIGNLNTPSLVRVGYTDYFGIDRQVKCKLKLNNGIPFCHQGMILPRIGYSYDCKYKYGADYLALLNFDPAWPLPMLSDGQVWYDTTGVSTINRWTADKWTAKVIRNRFGLVASTRYLVVCLLKLAVKRTYDVVKYSFSKFGGIY